MRIKGYKIEEVLAERQDLTLIRGTQKSLNRPVFIKILNDLDAESDILTAFSREAQLLAQLNHPNIITIYELNVTEQQPYLVLEYFVGEDLYHYSHRVGTLDAESLINIAFQILSGCAKAHENGILHGDLKPENILINGDGLAKLTDFGLASILTGKNDILAGSPGFLAPELALGEQRSELTDIYAMGMTLYTLAAGENPLLGKNLTESLNLAIQQEPPSLDKVRDDLPPLFVRLVKNMIAKAPHDRIQSCERAIELLIQEFQAPKLSKLAVNSAQAISISPSSTPRRTTPLLWGFLIMALVVSIFGINMVKGLWNNEEPSAVETSIISPAIPEQSISDSANTPMQDSLKQTTHEKPAQEQDIQSPIVETNKLEATQVSTDDEKTQNEPSMPGFLHLAASPWAEIHIDGQDAGFTPMPEAIRLDDGEHTVHFLHPDFPEIIKTVTVESGIHDTLAINWSQSFGFLMVNVHPWAEIYINSISHDLTPLERPIPLQPGEYQLLLKNPDYAPWHQFHSIEAGDTLFLNVRLNASDNSKL